MSGKLYFVPHAYSGIGAVYNMETLAKLGVQRADDVESRCSLCATRRRTPVSPRTRSASRSWVTQLIPYALVPTLVYRTQPNFEARLKAGKASFSKSRLGDGREQVRRR